MLNQPTHHRDCHQILIQDRSTPRPRPARADPQSLAMGLGRYRRPVRSQGSWFLQDRLRKPVMVALATATKGGPVVPTGIAVDRPDDAEVAFGWLSGCPRLA
jgi:hypothetical protein